MLSRGGLPIGGVAYDFVPGRVVSLQFVQAAGWPVDGSRIKVDELAVPLRLSMLVKTPAMAS
jgi:hypothetical protein